MTEATLDVWDEDGDHIFGATSAPGKIVGIVTTSSGVAGSISVPEAFGRRPFFAVAVIGATGGVFPPVVTFVGTTLAWNASYGAANIAYGYV